MTKRKADRPNHMTPAERDECVRLYAAGGITQDRLAEMFDRELNTIQRLIRRRGAQRRNQSDTSIHI